MRKLLRVHISVWIIIAITFVISIISVIIILNYRVESVYKSNIRFDKAGQYLQVPATESLKFHKGNEVTIRFEKQYYIGKIGNIKETTKGMMEISVTWKYKSLPPIPNGHFPIQIIHDNNKLIYSIFSPSV